MLANPRPGTAVVASVVDAAKPSARERDWTSAASRLPVGTDRLGPRAGGSSNPAVSLEFPPDSLSGDAGINGEARRSEGSATPQDGAEGAPDEVADGATEPRDSTANGADLGGRRVAVSISRSPRDPQRRGGWGGASLSFPVFTSLAEPLGNNPTFVRPLLPCPSSPFSPLQGVFTIHIKPRDPTRTKDEPNRPSAPELLSPSVTFHPLFWDTYGPVFGSKREVDNCEILNFDPFTTPTSPALSSEKLQRAMPNGLINPPSWPWDSPRRSRRGEETTEAGLRARILP